MAGIIRKTFGGLSLSYYLRQFLFGLIFTALIGFTMLYHPKTGVLNKQTLFLMVICQFLYPYARFVYESIVGYILGNNVFYFNAIFSLMFKLIMMAVCYCFSIFIAPIGLIYLYFYHSHQEKIGGE